MPTDTKGCPVIVAGSTGRRNTGVKSLSWGFKLRGRTRCNACRSSCSAVLVATNLPPRRLPRRRGSHSSAPAGFRVDQALRHIGAPRLHLATRPFLPQRDGAARIMAYDVE